MFSLSNIIIFGIIHEIFFNDQILILNIIKLFVSPLVKKRKILIKEV